MDETFTQNEVLTPDEPIVDNTGISNSKCSICNKICINSRGLKIHMSKKHFNRSTNDACTPDSATDILPHSPVETLLSKITDFKRNIALLKRIPKGVRNAAAEKLSDYVCACITSNSLEDWSKLLLFSYECLRIPEKQESKSLTYLVKQNISSDKLPEVKKKKRKELTIEQRVVKKIEDFDTRGAVRIISSNNSIVENNEENFSKLNELHPALSREVQLPEPPNAENSHIEVTEKLVIKSISSFPNGSASGIDGLSPQHLKDLTSKSAGEQGSKLLKNITRLVNFMLHGKVNVGILKILYGANLFAFNKKDGGIRPIAVGSTFRRLTAKISCFIVQDKCRNYFQPFQLGFASSQGCESIVHASRTFLEQNRLTKDIFLKIDYKNAFNCVERDVLLQEVKEHVPELYPFIWQCYASPSMLFFGNQTIYSQTGCQQGDPVSTLAFSLALHPIILKLKSKLKLFYLDDGTLAGDPDIVIEDIKTLLVESKKIGLSVNPNKCELYFLSDIDQQVQTSFENILPGIRTVSASELSLLGSPLCEDGYMSPMKKRLDNFKIMMERLEKLPKQVSYFLLKNCLGIPKLLYTMRTTPTFLHSDILKEMDNMMKICLESLINVHLTTKQWYQASLPIDHGGLGIRSVCDLSLPTFLASCSGTKPIVSTILNISVDNLVISSWTEAIEIWEVQYGKKIDQEVKTQSQLDDIVVKYKFDKEMLFDNGKDIARIKALQNKEAGAWLNAFPSKQVGTLIEDESFRICVGLRLGSNLCRSFVCKCGEVVDEKGMHPLSCQNSAGRYFRHAEVNNIIKRALANIDIPSQLEPTGLDRTDGKRPDGVTIVPWTRGQSVVWDFTCTDTLADSHVEFTKKKAGAAAELACQKKHAKYCNIKSRGLIFIALAVETMGIFCEEGKRWVKDIGKKLIEKTGNSRASEFLFQQISIATQRGNAGSILSVLPMKKDETLYYI